MSVDKKITIGDKNMILFGFFDFVAVYYIVFCLAGIWSQRKSGVSLGRQLCNTALEFPIILRIFEVW